MLGTLSTSGDKNKQLCTLKYITEQSLIFREEDSTAVANIISAWSTAADLRLITFIHLEAHQFQDDLREMINFNFVLSFLVLLRCKDKIAALIHFQFYCKMLVYIFLSDIFLLILWWHHTPGRSVWPDRHITSHIWMSVIEQPDSASTSRHAIILFRISLYYWSQ